MTLTGMGENSGYSCVTDALSAISLSKRAWCELGKGTDDPGAKDVLMGLCDPLGISLPLVAIIIEQDRVATYHERASDPEDG